jgi:hypothetical protein
MRLSQVCDFSVFIGRILTIRVGKGNQKRDISWWPKVATFDGSGLHVGCWTEICERWFQKRLEGIRSGRPPNSSATWKKNLTYERRAGMFFSNANNIGRGFLRDECRIQEFS